MVSMVSHTEGALVRLNIQMEILFFGQDMLHLHFVTVSSDKFTFLILKYLLLKNWWTYIYSCKLHLSIKASFIKMSYTSNVK